MAGTDVLFEIAWKVLPELQNCPGEDPSVATTLVRPSITLSRRDLSRISRLCGIGAVELAKAPDIHEVARVFAQVIDRHQPAGIVIHYAAFERPFLAMLWEIARPGTPLPVPVICTRDRARGLLPELESYSLKAVAGYFDDPCGDMKRAGANVDATISVWRGLDAIAASDATKSPGAGRPGQELRSMRLSLPDVPGTYRFFDARGRILYVGKATSLYHRVNSYFRGGVRGDSRKREMMAQVKRIEVCEAPSPLHAALDEFRVIVELAPPYNIAMKKDDRPVIWLDRASLNALSSRETVNHRRALGPFATESVFADIRSLAAIWRGDEPEKPLEFLFPGLDAGDDVLPDALSQAIESLGMTSRSAERPGSWLSLAVFRFLRGMDRDEDIEDPRGDSRDELPWDADCVIRSILRKLKRSAIQWSHTRSMRVLRGSVVSLATKASQQGGFTGSLSVSAPSSLCSIHQLQEAALILSGIKATAKDGSEVSVKLGSGMILRPGNLGFLGRLVFMDRAQPDPVSG